jgi:oxygen-independent coproporphyrinogen-3 oxidase
MVEALKLEIVLQKEFLEGKPVKTIYFGGGTPSVLHPQELSSIIEEIDKFYSISNDAEITLEANPDDLTKAYLSEIKALGINRLSIGTQSFHEELLRFMNRSHSAEQSVRSIENARAAGFDNLNMDLIYAVPAGSYTIWLKDLDIMMSLMPEHISAYHLTIEENTVFGNWYNKGKIKMPDEEESISQYRTLTTVLNRHGYEHYEVSNFALKGYMSQHNSAYWKGDHYLGIGPGAHSFNGYTRQYNISHNIKYIQALKSGVVPFEKEVLSRENKLNEYLLTGLRTLNGIDEEVIYQRFAYRFSEKEKSYLEQLNQQGKIVKIENRWILTEEGFLLADQIAEDLFTEYHD